MSHVGPAGMWNCAKLSVCSFTRKNSLCVKYLTHTPTTAHIHINAPSKQKFPLAWGAHVLMFYPGCIFCLVSSLILEP